MRNMRMIAGRAALLMVLAAVLFFLSGCSDEPGQFSETEPEIKLESIGQAKILQSVNEAKGKVVLVNFWATWCDPCRAEIANLKELREAYSEDDLMIIGVAVDREKNVVESFAKRMGFNYPVYIATESATQFFRVSAIPRLIIYGPSGDLKFNVEGLVNGEKLRSEIDKMLAG